MSKVSDKKKEKINEQILSILYEEFPKPLFTSQVACEIIRDEEFTRKLLDDLKEKKIIIDITKNSKGVDYRRRVRWRLANKTHEVFSNGK
jgi:hypothetical protein